MCLLIVCKYAFLTVEVVAITIYQVFMDPLVLSCIITEQVYVIQWKMDTHYIQVEVFHLRIRVATFTILVDSYFVVSSSKCCMATFALVQCDFLFALFVDNA